MPSFEDKKISYFFSMGVFYTLIKVQKENISINLPNFAFLVIRNCQNKKIIRKIDIFMTLKNPYVHLVPQCFEKFYIQW